MRFEVVESQHTHSEWRVEAINYAEDGEVYVTIFSGPRARERADQYAEWQRSIVGREEPCGAAQ